MALGLSEKQTKYMNVDYHMRKIYGNIKDEYEYVKKRRTFNTAVTILDKLEYVSFEDLAVTMYAKVDKELQPFVRKYEFMLEEALLHEWEFVKNLDKMLSDVAEYIKRNDYYAEWLEFLNFWNVKSLHKMHENVMNNNVYGAYMDLLYQTYQYLLPVYEREKLFGGLSLDGKPIWVDDKFAYCDYGTHKLENEIARQAKEGRTDTLVLEQSFIEKAYAKYGYRVSSIEDMQKLTLASQNYTNAITGMCYLANEECEEILNFSPMSVNRSVAFPREWRDICFYMENLKRRKFVIPNKGIYAVYQNASEIKKGYFKEVVKNDCVYLLFKLTTAFCGDIIGWYNTKTDDFYCNYSLSNRVEDEGRVKNFALENYYLLTVNEIDYSKRKLSVMHVSNGTIPTDLYARQPIVTYYLKSGKEYDRLKDKNGKGTEEGKSSFKVYDRRNYKPEKTEVSGYIRKLPVGQQASFEAKQYALSLGYDLSENETFVRPFVKKVLRVRE